MPNWCSNRLGVSGPQKDINDFQLKAKSKIQGGDQVYAFTLSAFLPCPPELLAVNADGKVNPELVAQFGASDWYQWCVHHWSTKWDVEGHLTESSPDALHYEFESAWGPPTNALGTIAAQWPNLTFTLEYCEPSNSFAGQTVWTDGVLESDDENMPIWDEFILDDDDDDDT